MIVSIYNYTTHFDTPFMEYKHYFTNKNLEHIVFFKEKNSFRFVVFWKILNVMT